MYSAQNYQQAYTEFTRLNLQAQQIPIAAPISRIDDITGCDRGRRARTSFTNSQLMELEREFKQCFFLHRTRRIDISKRLGLTEAQVKVWFQNRRMKLKRASAAANGSKNLKSIRADHIVARRLISSDTHIQTRSLPASEIHGSEKILPVITPLLAEVVTNPLDVPANLPIVIQHQAKLPILIQNKEVRTFKPQVMVKMPTTTTFTMKQKTIQQTVSLTPVLLPRQHIQPIKSNNAIPIALSPRAPINNSMKEGRTEVTHIKREAPSPYNFEINPIEQILESTQHFSSGFVCNQYPEDFAQQPILQSQYLPSGLESPESEQKEFDYQDFLSTLDALIGNEPTKQNDIAIKQEAPPSFDDMMETEASMDLTDLILNIKEECPSSMEQVDFKEPTTPELLKVLDDIPNVDFPVENSFCNFDNFVKSEPSAAPTPIVNFSFEDLINPGAKPTITVTF